MGNCKQSATPDCVHNSKLDSVVLQGREIREIVDGIGRCAEAKCSDAGVHEGPGQEVGEDNVHNCGGNVVHP